MTPIKCFWLDALPKLDIFFRRYHSERQEAGEPYKECCPGDYGYHNCMRYVDTINIEWERGQILKSYYSYYLQDDPRWPTKCDWCDYQFQDPLDSRQVFIEQKWLDSRDGVTEYTRSDWPTGAMYDCWWWSNCDKDINKYDDGVILTVVIPDGKTKSGRPRNSEWLVDFAREGCLWTRTGEIPNVTIEPTVKCGAFHGRVRNGYLEMV